MKVLSLFDGISCAAVALERLKIPIEAYYTSEIDPYAIRISRYNFPGIIRLGDVKNVHGTTESWVNNARDGHLLKGVGKDFDIGIDLLIGGSPCQDLSIAKKNRKGLAGERSGLFYEFVRILKEVKPTYFILENVASMSEESKATISMELGVHPIMINASLVSGQNRKRLFWTNVPNFRMPEDKGIMLKDVLLDGETEDLKSLCITATYHKKNARDFLKKGSGQMIRIGNIGTDAQAHRVYSPEGKSVALSALGGGQGAKTGLYLVQRPRGKNKGGEHHEKSPTVTSSSFEHNNHVSDGYTLRKLHPIECERLQGLPENYTELGINDAGMIAKISNSRRYQVIGNAFNVDVVAHILSFIKHEYV